MTVTILMPALSPTMTHGTLAKWLVNEGDAVTSGDVIAEIETDKATMEVEAVDDGVIGRIVVQGGTEHVAVNSVIGYLLEDGEDASAIDMFNVPPSIGNETMMTEMMEGQAQEKEPSQPIENVIKPIPHDRHNNAPQKRLFISPLARRIAGNNGIDEATLGAIKGSGPHGRIIKNDIALYMQAHAQKPAEPSGQDPLPQQQHAPEYSNVGADKATNMASQPIIAKDNHTQHYDVIKLNTMRKIIAERLSESKQTIPHFYLDIEANLDKVLQLRQTLNSKSDGSWKISINDIIIKAYATALTLHPKANVGYFGDHVKQYHDVDISVAVALDDGLITPIIAQANQQGLTTISRRMVDLAKQARAGTLQPEQYQGGTASLSNLGMFGINQFAAVINPPQALILAVGAGQKKPVVIDNALSIATMVNLTLSVDHRAIDGALGAQVLATIKGLLEDPETMLL